MGLGSALGLNDGGLIEERAKSFNEAVLELFGGFGNPAVEPVRFHAQPQPLNGVEIGRAWRQILWLEVMPVEALGLVPRRVVEHEDGAASFHLRVLYGKCVEEDLEGHRVAQVEEQCAESAILGTDGTKEVVTDMLAQIR